MEYMIRFTHVHETFRLPEIQALAVLHQIDLEVLSYSSSVGVAHCDIQVHELTINSLLSVSSSFQMKRLQQS